MLVLGIIGLFFPQSKAIAPFFIGIGAGFIAVGFK